MSKKIVTSSSGFIKNLALNTYRHSLNKEMRIKNQKKGLLMKISQTNNKRSKALDEILTESDNLNKMKAKSSAKIDTTPTRSEEEFLKKFRDTSTKGPNHSIAENRKNHLTNFLSDYILNGFQSGLFIKPDLYEFNKKQNTRKDPNGFVKNKYEFELSKIDLMSDLTALKIYWYISGDTEIDNEIDNYLDKCLKGQIRSTLTNERILNYVPKIVFVKDSAKLKLEKLDEYLMKIKIDLDREDTEAKNAQSYNEPPSSEGETEDFHQKKTRTAAAEKKLKSVDNLYGVDFTRLLESIRKSTGEQVPWSQSQQSAMSDTSLVPVTSTKNNELEVSKQVEEAAKRKFENSLKAFQINKRLQHQRLSRSTFLKLAQIQYEEYRENESN